MIYSLLGSVSSFKNYRGGGGGGKSDTTIIPYSAKVCIMIKSFLLDCKLFNDILKICPYFYPIPHGARFKYFWREGAGSEDFACASLPATPIDFQGNV